MDNRKQAVCTVDESGESRVVPDGVYQDENGRRFVVKDGEAKRTVSKRKQHSRHASLMAEHASKKKAKAKRKRKSN